MQLTPDKVPVLALIFSLWCLNLFSRVLFFDPPWGGEEYKPDGSSIALDDHDSILVSRQKKHKNQLEQQEQQKKEEESNSQIADAVNYFLTEMKIPILMKLPINADLKKLKLDDKTKFVHKIAKKFMIAGINF